MAASTQCFLHQYHALRSSPARTSSVSSPKPNQLICRAQKQDDANNTSNAVSRRLALTLLIGTAAIGSKVSPADAAYGEAANVFGKPKENTDFLPYNGDGFKLQVPAKWNPSKEIEFPGQVLRYEDNFDSTSNLIVAVTPTDKKSITDYGSPEDFLSKVDYLLGKQAYFGKTDSEGGFESGAVATANLLEASSATVVIFSFCSYALIFVSQKGEDGFYLFCFHPLIHTSKLDSSKTHVLFSSSLSSTLKNQSLLKYTSRTQFVCSSSSKDGFESSGDNNTSNFCIIEGPETVQDFGQMQFQEIQDNIRSRRNKIFLLMEEVRRLRIQQRLKNSNTRGETGEDENEMPDIPSTIPFLPNMTPKTLKQLYLTSFSFIAGIMVFGGLLAPVLELKLGLGGTSYEDFIRNMHLPMQLSQVDPIVASFSGGAVGVISALMLIEANNAVQQEKKKCKYCYGSGYLACARCSASGKCLYTEPISVNGSYQSLRAPALKRCANCSGTGKVMCPTCLCTGMVMASEHDLRIDPFD